MMARFFCINYSTNGRPRTTPSWEQKIAQWETAPPWGRTGHHETNPPKSWGKSLGIGASCFFKLVSYKFCISFMTHDCLFYRFLWIPKCGWIPYLSKWKKIAHPNVGFGNLRSPIGQPNPHGWNVRPVRHTSCDIWPIYMAWEKSCGYTWQKHCSFWLDLSWEKAGKA